MWAQWWKHLLRNEVVIESGIAHASMPVSICMGIEERASEEPYYAPGDHVV